jgi:hypothetical protein
MEKKIELQSCDAIEAASCSRDSLGSYTQAYPIVVSEEYGLTQI